MIIFYRPIIIKIHIYITIYTCIHQPHVFNSSLYTPTSINVYHSLIITFFLTISRNDSEIKISASSEQDVPNSNVSHKYSNKQGLSRPYSWSSFKQIVHQWLVGLHRIWDSFVNHRVQLSVHSGNSSFPYRLLREILIFSFASFFPLRA